MHYSRCLRHRSSSSISAFHSQYDAYNALTQVFNLPHEQVQKGNLAGLNYVVKENICTEVGNTTCCSAVLGAASNRPYRSPFNAACIDRLNKGGASMLAKTNMDEFGMGSFTTHSPYGPTINPHDSLRTAGGSSGGSAAALWIDRLDGQKIDFALGTDTGGSVRIPASYCGLFGFKPSYGRISRWGVVPYANSLDTVGILAKRHGGLDIIRRVFAELDHEDERDATTLTRKSRSALPHVSRVPGAGSSRDNPGFRIGIPREYNIQELSPSVLATWRSGLAHLSARGCEIVPISLPSTQSALAAYYILAPAEVSSNLQKYSGVFYGARSEVDRLDGRLYAATRAMFGPEAQRRILMGCLSLSSDRFDNYYLGAQRIRRRVVEEFNRCFSRPHILFPPTTSPSSSTQQLQQEDGMGTPEKSMKVDYLLTPTAPTVAPLLSEIADMTPAESYAADVFTVPASMAGLPSLSVPFGADEGGMPIGVQLIGQYGHDEGVLDVARLLED